jgi:hypothetical protein
MDPETGGGVVVPCVWGMLQSVSARRRRLSVACIRLDLSSRTTRICSPLVRFSNKNPPDTGTNRMASSRGYHVSMPLVGGSTCDMEPFAGGRTTMS